MEEINLFFGALRIFYEISRITADGRKYVTDGSPSSQGRTARRSTIDYSKDVHQGYSQLLFMHNLAFSLRPLVTCFAKSDYENKASW